MKVLEKIKRALIFPLIGIIFATTALTNATPVYADPVEEPEAGTVVPGAPSESTTETTTTESPAETETESGEGTEETSGTDSEKTENATCYSQVGGLGWLICPVSAFLSRAIDTIYNLIEDFLILEPLSMESDSPVFTIWVYARNITNVVFICFLMVVIYSQITGFGISNYGIKKMLPRLIIAAILVNLSYIICVLAVDVSNVVGRSLHDFLSSIADNAAASGQFGEGFSVNFYDIFTTIAAGGVVGALAVGLSGGPLGLLLALIPVILGGVISVLIGLATISLRQAVIILLVAIAPLAFVAYLLPNTEKWFKKWTNTFSQMLFFYPMFSLLFGASKIASGIFMGSANSMLGVILGLAVRVLPLILALSLMKMAGSVLGGVSNALGKLGDKANGGIKNFVEPYKATNRAQQLAKGMRQPFNPLSGASWRAAAHKRQANIKFRQEQAEKTVAGLTSEHLGSLRRNQRIIGYDKNNQPIYTQLPARRTNKYMDAEAEAREVDLRAQVDNLKTENAYGELSSYQKENGIRHGRATKNASRMGGHYLDLRTQMAAKARNDEADERFYNDTIIKASERDMKTGELQHKDLYEKYVRSALGADGYKINQTTEEGRRLAEQAVVNVIGDAYSHSEAQRANNIKRFEAYMDKQVTKEVLRQYEDMIKYDNIDGIIASHHILAKRGDYDKIAKHMTDYMNSGKIKLGEDASNALAMNFLSMKDAAPPLARLGKFMNMETWAYTDGNRQTQEITMDQYVTGEVIGDIDKKGKAYHTKIKLASGLEGTRLTGIDRTAFGTLDEIMAGVSSTKGYSKEKAIAARKEVEDAMRPQLISAIPTFPSGSEQIRSAIGHIICAKVNGATGKWESTFRDKGTIDGDVDREMAKYNVESMLHGYTANDLINMKTDAWNGFVFHYAYEYAENNNIRDKDGNIDWNTDDAHEYAYSALRECLKKPIERLTQGNINTDRMKQTIYEKLGIKEGREAYFNSLRHNNVKGVTDIDPRILDTDQASSSDS